MSYKDNNCKEKYNREIIVGNTLFNYQLNQISENCWDLVATPCNVPTSVYCIGRINERKNCCNNMEYYQAFINTDPVEIIQDCNIKSIITRSIEIYFNNLTTFENCNKSCCRNIGLF